MTQLEFPLRVRELLKSRGYDYDKSDFTYKMDNFGMVDVYFGGVYSKHKFPFLHVGFFAPSEENAEKIVSRVEHFYQKLQVK